MKKIKTPLEADYKGDKTKQVRLEYDADYQAYGYQLSTRNLRKYIMPEGDTGFIVVGKKHTGICFKLVLGNLYVKLHRDVFSQRGFKDWEREVNQRARADPFGFIKELFGIDLIDLDFPETILPSIRSWDNEEYWDSILSVKMDKVPFKKQCDDASAKIKETLDAQRLLVDNMFSEQAKELNDQLDKRKDTLKHLLSFKEIHRDTPFEDVPKWVWSGDRQVCKDKIAKIASAYKGILTEQVIKDSDADEEDDDYD